MQAKSLREMLARVEGDSLLAGVPGASADMEARIDAVAEQHQSCKALAAGWRVAKSEVAWEYRQ